MEKDSMILDDRPEYIQSLTNRAIGYPERLTLEMTSYCNLRCWMCPKTTGVVNTMPNHLIEDSVIREVAKILPHVEILQLSGLWGEVFLHPEVYLRILKLAKESGCEVRTISNGTLMTKKLAEQLVALGLDHLTISIDAATPETYKDIRIGGNFKTLMKNLRKLQKIKKKAGSAKPVVQFAFVGMKKNIAELPRLVELASQLGVEGIVLQGMGEYEDTEGESLAYHHRELGKEIYEKSAALGREVGVQVTLFPPDQFEEASGHMKPIRGEKELEWKIPEGVRKACRVPWEETVITTTGEVLPCCSASSPLGNILDAPFEEIWLSEAYHAFRRQVLSKDPPLMCKACTGIGWRKEIDVKDFLKMGKTDGQLGVGWYQLEANDDWGIFRWSKSQATFFLRGGEASILELRMRIAGRPKEGKILVNDVPVGNFSFQKSQWEVLRFPLPKGIGELAKVDIITDNAAREDGDKRNLGIALSEARMC